MMVNCCWHYTAAPEFFCLERVFSRRFGPIILRYRKNKNEKTNLFEIDKVKMKFTKHFSFYRQRVDDIKMQMQINIKFG